MLNQRAFTVAMSLLLGAGIAGAPTPVRASGAIYVGPGGGTGGCASPAFAYRTDGTADDVQIRNAADASSSGDTIFICAGSFDITGEINLGSKSLTIQGAGQSQTILDAHEQDTRFFFATGSTITFKGLTMQNAQLYSGNPWVGAIWGEDNTNINVYGSSFLNNYALNGMGVIFSRSGNINVVNSAFDGNYSDTDDYWGGGAINATADDGSATVTIRNSSFTNNYSESDGGAVLSRGALNIYDSTFVNNESASKGGAIAVYGDLHISGSRFASNVSHDEGAAAYAECDSELRATGNTFISNHAVGDGSDGGAFNIDCEDGASIQINRNTFTRNTADDVGGAIDEDNGDLMVVTGNTFSQNSSSTSESAPDGGGAIWATNIKMTRNIFSRNTSLGCGGAVYIAGSDYRTSSRNEYAGNRGGILPRLGDVCRASDLYDVK